MVACAPWGAVGELAATRHGAFNRRLAAQSGLSPKVITRLLRDGHLREPIPGVLVVAGSPDSWRQRVIIPTLVGGHAVVAGFRSAAALHGLDGYTEGPVEIVTAVPRRLPIADLVVHRGDLHASDVVEIDGIRCTGVARTLADLGSTDRYRTVEVAFNDAWRRGASLRWMRETADRLHRPGQAGTGTLLRLLDEADAHERPLESVLEARLESALKRARVHGLVRQHKVVNGSGRFVARVDFAIPDLRLAIEAHSRRFHHGVTVEARDRTRDELLRQTHWHTAYVTDADLRTALVSEGAIRCVVSARAKELGLWWSTKLGHWCPTRSTPKG